MTDYVNVNANPRDLSFKPIQIQPYKILSVEVAKDLDPQFRRLAFAEVIIKNENNIWDHRTKHRIELKHFYNHYSKGPKRTRFEDLVGLVIKISQLEPPINGSDLDTVTWSIHQFDLDF